jgi:hypothetical protein
MKSTGKHARARDLRRAALLGALTIFGLRLLEAGPTVEPIPDSAHGRAFLDNLHGCLPEGALSVRGAVSHSFRDFDE